MQIAHILQVLALWKWEEIDPRLSDLYSRFDKDALSSVLEAMLDPAADAYLLVNNGASDDEDLDLQLTYFDDGIANSDLDSFGLNPSTTGILTVYIFKGTNRVKNCRCPIGGGWAISGCIRLIADTCPESEKSRSQNSQLSA